MKVRIETEQRLERWALWSQRNADGALGYPRRSIEARLQDEGGVLSKNPKGSRPLDIDEDAEEMNGFIVELGQHYRDFYEAIKLEYLHYGALETKAKHLGVSRTRFIMYRDTAKMWLDGRLKQERELQKNLTDYAPRRGA